MSKLQRIEAAVIGFVHRNRVTVLQAALGIVFLWFGLLKVIGKTPVTELVATTVPFLDPVWFVPFLGVWEMVVGGLLLWGRAVRLTLALFLGQMLGTLGVLVLQPGVAFQNYNPLLLTVEGEFVVKNLVLIAAGLSIGGHLLRVRDGQVERVRPEQLRQTD